MLVASHLTVIAASVGAYLVSLKWAEHEERGGSDASLLGQRPSRETNASASAHHGLDPSVAEQYSSLQEGLLSGGASSSTQGRARDDDISRVGTVAAGGEMELQMLGGDGGAAAEAGGSAGEEGLTVNRRTSFLVPLEDISGSA